MNQITEITINLDANNYRLLISVLAKLPNESNTYMLLADIESQYRSQLESDKSEDE